MPQAIHTDSFNEIRKIIDSPNKEESPELVEEKNLAHMGNTKGWEILKDYILDLSKHLEDINKSMMEQGASFEDIGKNVVVAQLASDLLEKVIHKVEDAQEAVATTK